MSCYIDSFVRNQWVNYSHGCNTTRVTSTYEVPPNQKHEIQCEWKLMRDSLLHGSCATHTNKHLAPTSSHLGRFTISTTITTTSKNEARQQNNQPCRLRREAAIVRLDGPGKTRRPRKAATGDDSARAGGTRGSAVDKGRGADACGLEAVRLRVKN